MPPLRRITQNPAFDRLYASICIVPTSTIQPCAHLLAILESIVEEELLLTTAATLLEELTEVAAPAGESTMMSVMEPAARPALLAAHRVVGIVAIVISRA